MPPERPSPLRVCSQLDNNYLTGSVPSSLSALTNLQEVCMPPSSTTAFARVAEGGRIGRLCSERTACRGVHCMSGGIEGGGAAAGLMRCSQRGPLHAMWLRSTQRRSTAERPSPPRVCSQLENNELTGTLPRSLSALIKLTSLCVPPRANGACTCGRGGAESFGSSPSSAACRGNRVGGVQQQGCFGTFRGDPCTRCGYGVLKGHPLLWGTGRGYLWGTWLLWVRRSMAPSGRFHFGCAATSTTTS